ncbi:MAG: hypothetical protein JRH10_02380 [Deltaproteobacteria bacterium]|nr:hypothetical protein [Deltaproteobacteria bacterium]MBW2444705.1 hypothetical protein [Deltaproteobacteria bacterium]
MRSRNGAIRGGAAALLGVFLVLAARPAPAQELRVTRLGGAVEFGTDLAFQEVKSPTGEDRTFERFRFDERLELFADGYVVSREFLTYHVGGNFGLRQELLGGDDFEGEDSDSTRFGYDVFANFFPAKRVSAHVFANRFEDSTVQSFGNDTDSRSEVFGAGVDLRFPIFPSRLVWQRRTSEIDSRGGLFRSRRDETRDILEFSGRHNSDSIDATLRVRQEGVTDRSVPTAGGDFDLTQLNGTARYRWGPYYEKSVRNSISYFRREGRGDVSIGSGFESTSASTQFLWDPTEDLQLRAQHDFDWFDFDEQTSILNSMLFSASHQLFESLRTHANLTLDHEDVDSGQRYSVEPFGGLSYRKDLPADSRVLFDFNVGYRLRDSSVDARDRLVRGELLTLDNITGNILANRRVDAATIEVRETVGGLLLTEGEDYDVSTFAEATSIDPILSISSDLGLGDSIVVDYVFRTDPSARIGRTAIRWSLAWEHPWVVLRYSHSESHEELFEGDSDALLLDDVQRDAYRIDLRGQTGRSHGNLGAEYIQDQTGTVDFAEWLVFASGSAAPIRRLRLAANAQMSRKTFNDRDRDVDSITAGASATWRARRYWDLRVFSNYRRIEDSESLDQEDVEVGLRSRIRFGRLEITPSLSVTQRERGGSESLDVRGVLRMRRGF